MKIRIFKPVIIFHTLIRNISICFKQNLQRNGIFKIFKVQLFTRKKLKNFEKCTKHVAY